MSAPSPVPAIKSLDEFLNGSFDYLVVGGGTAGLAIAARLTENPNITVGVIEAGPAKIGDPTVMTPAAFPMLLGRKEYDWMMKTVPQAGTNNKIHALPRGKLLGGSSAINFMMYVRGQEVEYDDWAKLSGYGSWSYKSLKPYFLKHETFDNAVSQPDTNAGDSAFHVDHHGTSGPIKTSFANWRAPAEVAYHQAARNAGLLWSPPDDAWSGKHLGGYANLSSIERTGGPGLRSYSVTGYLIPNGSRPNLMVLTDALVEKVVVRKEGDQALVATHVVFSHSGTTHVLSPKTAIILSAGTIQTPQILQLSGIGPASLLSSVGVPCLVDNPRVGRLEDHILSGLVFDMVEGEISLDHVGRPEVAADAMQKYTSGQGGPLANGIGNSAFLSLAEVATKEEMHRILSAAQKVVDGSEASNRVENEILFSRLQNPNAATIQLVLLVGRVDFSRQDDQTAFLAPSPSTTSITLGVAIAHAFSRGSVRITSTDPTVQPDIDPAYLAQMVDALLMAVGLRVANKIFGTSPLKEKIKGRVQPAPHVNLDDTDAALAYVREHTITEYHPIGTAGLGTVVDERLNVKGVRGLKVCDASILPMHVSGNICAPVYAIAEKGADIFLEDHVKK